MSDSTGRLCAAVRRMRAAPACLMAALALLCAWAPAFPAAGAVRFEVSFPAEVESGEITGRLLVVISPHAGLEPRLGLRRTNPVGYRPDLAVAFLGRDVEGLRPGRTVVVDADADSYPVDLDELPAGDYHVQAVLVRYTLARRSDGHRIWVPITDRAVNPHLMPGNLYSAPVEIRIDRTAERTVRLSLTEVIPPLPEPEDTQWLRHVRIRSEILSRFWGVPMYLRAHVLVPRGFDENPQARYPAIYLFGHGQAPFFFNPDPASHEASLQAVRAANLETGYEFYQSWISDDFPRMVAITFEMPSPYFIESYAVNSANNGPYGDAITRELIPYLEREFRLIPERHARVVEGNSTGGWEALAMQLHYPDVFGGAWVLNPDPIDFRHYGLVNIYEDENMFRMPLPPFMSTERPLRRTVEGQTLFTVRQMARFEAALGSRCRSGAQLGIWQATHGPVGPDGYPVPLFDPKTGVIDKRVVEFMRENGYDLSEYARRNWETLGPKLAGRLTFITGEMDDFHLNLGVYAFEDMVREKAGPEYPIRFEYGRPKKGHNWHHTTWAGMVREMAAHMKRTAPPGADVESWHN